MALPRFLTFALLAAVAFLGGCIYRPDIQQGNLLSVKDVEQVQPGMTRSQVRFLLGTPMISDPFAPHRWDYIYRLEYGRRNRSIDTVHFIVFFEGDNVTKVEMIDVVDPQLAPPDEPRRGWNPFRRKDPEPPAPGLAAQPPGG